MLLWLALTYCHSYVSRMIWFKTPVRSLPSHLISLKICSLKMLYRVHFVHKLIAFQPIEDYLVYHAGVEGLGVSLNRPPHPLVDSLSVVAGADPGTVEQSVESRLPRLGNLTASTGSWQTVPGTRWIPTHQYTSIIITTII